MTSDSRSGKRAGGLVPARFFRGHLRRVLFLSFVATLVASAASAPAETIVEQPVAFTAETTNPPPGCVADLGDLPELGQVTIQGTLVAPRSKLVDNAPVTLYLHGVGLGQFYWRFDQVRDYNFARVMASRGHVSVVIDRLGYGKSTKPDGLSSSFTRHTVIACQIIAALKSGTYEVADGAGAVGFGRVALAGHSAGGFIAEQVAYTFRNIDALVVMSHADQNASPLFGQTFTTATANCRDPNSDHYTYFGDAEQFRQGQIHDMEDRVVNALLALRSRDPCGDYFSAPAGLVADQVGLGTITVPVLVMIGQKDAYFPGQAETQASRFAASTDRRGVTMKGAGHLLALERTRYDSLEVLSEWLARRAF